MKYIFGLTHNYRNTFKGFLNNYSLEQLNKIPAGYNNNIIWHIGHIVATYDILCYKLCGLETHYPIEFIESYKKGTKPERDVTIEEVEIIKNYLTEQIERGEADYNNSIFNACQPYTTSFGNELSCIDDIIKFNLVHEGLHLGMILSMRKFI